MKKEIKRRKIKQEKTKIEIKTKANNKKNKKRIQGRQEKDEKQRKN